MFEPGAIVAEKYWVERVLGRGGMGVVVAATHLQLGQRFALKFLRPEALRDGELVERFLREARAASRLRGEHVGRVVDVGATADGAPYLVMEYLEGHDLATALARRGPLPVATVVDYVVQACVGLAEAHATGVVHRDLKPSNLFLTRRPDGTPLVKVMDFGIAKAVGRIDAAITESAAVMGSPGYMSPEQLRSARDVDARADLWSLGVVLYELVSGRRPYDASTITELAMLVATEPVPPLDAAVPRGFAAVVMRCLEKDPARRYRDVGALAAALAPFGSAESMRLATSAQRVHTAPPEVDDRAGLEALMGATTLSRAASVSVSPPAIGGRRRMLWLGSAAAAAAVLVAVVVIAASGGGGGSAAAVAPTVDAGAGGMLVTPLDAGAAAESLVVGTGSGSGSGSGSATGSGSGSGSGTGSGSGSGTGSGSGSGSGSGRVRRGSASARGSASDAGATPSTGTGAAPATTPTTTPTITPPTTTPTAPTTGSGAGTARPVGIPGDADGDGIPDQR